MRNLDLEHQLSFFPLLPPPGPSHCIPHCIHFNIDGELTKYFTPATYTLNRSPRYDLSHTDVEDWVGRLLPSRLVRARSDLLISKMTITEFSVGTEFFALY